MRSLHPLLLTFALTALLAARAQATIPVVEVKIAPPALESHPNGISIGESFTGEPWPESWIALTFDDGPHPIYTPQVLDLLRTYGVRATFFLAGMMAARHPALVREIAAQGHTIAVHSYSHPNFTKISHEKALAEIRTGFAAVEKALGEPAAPFFRFPFLASTRALRTHLTQNGTTPFTWWDSLTLGSKLEPKAGKLRHGVLIDHDTHPVVIPMLRRFLDQMEKYGYVAILPVPEKN